MTGEALHDSSVVLSDSMIYHVPKFQLLDVDCNRHGHET